MHERSLSRVEIEQLVGHLRGRLGMWLWPDDIAALIAAPPTTVDEFTEALMVAEGLAWPMGTDIRPDVREFVARAFARA